MKLSPPKPRHTSPNDPLGQGMDIALTVALLFGIGFALDRWLGTTPVFMIVMTLIAGVGFFAKYKYQYDARMDELQAERAERANAGGSVVDP